MDGQDDLIVSEKYCFHVGKTSKAGGRGVVFGEIFQIGNAILGITTPNAYSKTICYNMQLGLLNRISLFENE